MGALDAPALSPTRAAELFAVRSVLQDQRSYLVQLAAWEAADMTGLALPTDWSRWLVAGSSTVTQLQSYLATIAAGYNATLVATAQGGWRIEHTLAWLGSHPMQAGGFFTIPASEPGTFQSSNVSTQVTAGFAMHGYWEGFASIPGTVSKTEGTFASAWTFARDSAGSAQAIPYGSKFIPDQASRRNCPIIFNPGKNNMSGSLGGTGDIGKIITWSIEAVNWLRAKGHPIIVLGHFADTDTPATGATRDRINALNAALAARFPEYYIDLGVMLSEPTIWAETGVTPTTADLEQQALGNLPPSLGADTQHMNTTARAVAAARIAAKITAVGWSAHPASLSSLTLAYFLADDAPGTDGAAMSGTWPARSGTVAGLAINGFTGASGSGAPTVIDGAFRGHRAVRMEAAGQHHLATPSNSLSITGDVTYLMLFRVPATTGAAQSILNGGHRVYTNSAGTTFYLDSNASTGDGEFNVAGVVTPNGEWIILAATVAGANSALEVQGASSTGTLPVTAMTRLRFGVNSGGTSQWANLDLVACRVFNAALSADQLAQAKDELLADQAQV